MKEVGVDFERGDVDGVPVLWAAGEGPLLATLIFRSGRADETLPTAGLTHLVEHLALFPLGITSFFTNGEVDQLRTMFVARGAPEEVVSFFRSVLGSLSSLPLDRLENEKRVLETEGASREGGAYAMLMGLRFGAHGHGLINYAELGIGSATAESVLAWARRRFTRDNAVMWMTGPIPDELVLELAPGERFPPPEPEPLPQLKLPAYASLGVRGVAISSVVERSAAFTTGLGIAAERAHAQLRLRHGLTYSVTNAYDPLTATRAHVMIGADCLDEHAGAARDNLLRVLDELSAEPLSSDELESAKTRAARALNDPLTLPHHLDRAATNELVGAPPMT